MAFNAQTTGGWVAGPPQIVVQHAPDGDAMDVDTPGVVQAHNSQSHNPFLQRPAMVPHFPISPLQPFASFVPLPCIPRPIWTVQASLGPAWPNPAPRPIWDCFRPPTPDLWLESDVTCKGCLNINMRCSVNDLPQELTDLILEFVTDKATLASCTLVCKSWTAWSTRLYFRKFRVFRPVVTALYDYLQLTERARENIRHFIIESTDGWAGGRRHGSHSGSPDGAIVAHTFSVNELVSVISLLPKLECLELHSTPIYLDMWLLPLVGWPANFHPSSPDLTQLREARLSLKLLRLVNMASFVADISCMQAFLSAFERVDDLYFSDKYIPSVSNRALGRNISYEGPFNMERLAPLETKRLHVESYRPTSFMTMLNVFTGTVNGAHVESLELEPTDGGMRAFTEDATFTFLARLTGLEELILRTPSYRLTDWLSQGFRLPVLSHFPKLRTLEVHELPMHALSARADLLGIAHAVLDEVFGMLETARRGALTHVRLGFAAGILLKTVSATSHHDTSFTSYNWRRFLGARCFQADTFQELSFEGIYSTEWNQASIQGAAAIRAVVDELGSRRTS